MKQFRIFPSKMQPILADKMLQECDDLTCVEFIFCCFSKLEKEFVYDKMSLLVLNGLRRAASWLGCIKFENGDFSFVISVITRMNVVMQNSSFSL